MALDLLQRAWLLEQVYDVIEQAEAEDLDVISIQGLRHLVGSRESADVRPQPGKASP